jgi:hypothetical protein
MESQREPLCGAIFLVWHLPRTFGRSLLAILLGNAVYFLLMPRLPSSAQHQAFRLDLGLLVDFAVCVAVFGVLQLVWRVLP